MSPQDSQLVVPYLTLRQMIGWVALLMPIVVRLGAYCFEGVHSTNSISAYYYTGMRDVFVATLVLAGALLACYRSPAHRDTIVAVLAGLAAIGIGLFPMDPQYAQEILYKFPAMTSQYTQEVLQRCPDLPRLTCYRNTGILGYHFYFVGVFFALAFYLVFFRFRAFTPKDATRQKIHRNRIYRICGTVMFVGFVAIGVLDVVHAESSIFWPESLAVISFSVAWLVKGQIVLKDQQSAASKLSPRAPL